LVGVPPSKGRGGVVITYSQPLPSPGTSPSSGLDKLAFAIPKSDGGGVNSVGPGSLSASSSSDQVSSLAALKRADSATELALAHQVGNVSLDSDSSPPAATDSTTTKTQILTVPSSTSTPGPALIIIERDDGDGV
jgi:hypothetical protein